MLFLSSMLHTICMQMVYAEAVSPLNIMDTVMELTTSVKNQGVVLGADLSMKSHIANVCRACFYHLKELHRVRLYVKVANAMVSSQQINRSYPFLAKITLAASSVQKIIQIQSLHI